MEIDALEQIRVNENKICDLVKQVYKRNSIDNQEFNRKPFGTASAMYTGLAKAN